MNWRSGNAMIIILGSIAVAVTLVTGYFFFKNGASKKAEINISNSPDKIPSTPLETNGRSGDQHDSTKSAIVASDSARVVCKIPKELEIANTKVYVDRRNCFTFRYPAEWNFEPIDSNVGQEYWVDFKNGYFVSTHRTLGQSTKEFTESYFSNVEGGYSELSYITLNGYKVAKFYIQKASVDPTPHGTVNYFFDNNTIGVVIEAAISGDVKESMKDSQLEEIASSFRFW